MRLVSLETDNYTLLWKNKNLVKTMDRMFSIMNDLHGQINRVATVVFKEDNDIWLKSQEHARETNTTRVFGTNTTPVSDLSITTDTSDDEC